MRKRLPIAAGAAILGAVLALGILRPAQREAALPGEREPEGRISEKSGEVPVFSDRPGTGSGELRALLRSISLDRPPGLSSAELRALLERAVRARAEEDWEGVSRALAEVARHGSAVQVLLAELLLEESDAAVREMAATALVQVATAETAPFLLQILQEDSSEEIRALAAGMLTRFRFAGAAPFLEQVLFDAAGPMRLRRLAAEYFAEMEDEFMLVRALRDLPPMRDRLAEALARVGTEGAARALFEVWKEGFRPSGPLEDYALLRSLARFPAGILDRVLTEGLEQLPTASHRNVWISLLAHADRSFALERLERLLRENQETTVRRQVLHVAASLGGPEGQCILLEAMADPLSQGELLAAANGLLRQERLEAGFEEVFSLYSSEQDPALRSVLARLLSREERRLEEDRSLAMGLLEEAERNLHSGDAAVRGLNIDVAASLSRYGDDPVARLETLYRSMTPEERDAHPGVLERLGEHEEHPGAREILTSSLGDEGASAPRRVLAGDALFRSGRVEPVYQAIQDTQDPQVVSLLAGIALARGGAESRAKLREIASASAGNRKEVLERQLEVWSMPDSAP